MYGLTAFDIETIISTLKDFPEVKEAIVFGSRAKGTHKRGSDIDLALKGRNITRVVTTIAGLLNDEAPLPYFFDVLDYQAISHPPLKEHIDRVGQTFYRSQGG